jgi:hypothetical protein
LDESLVERLQNGATSHKPEVAEFCRIVLAKLGPRKAWSGRFKPIPKQAEEEDVIETLETFVTALEDEGQPDDIPGFVMNIVDVMNRFNTSPSILGKSATCIELLMPFYPDISSEMIYECLSVCYGILSGETFLNGDEAFSAVENLEKLVQLLVGTVTTDRLLAAMASLVAESNGVKLDAVLAALDAIVRDSRGTITEEMLAPIAESLTVFHPEIELPEYLTEPVDPTDIIRDYEESFARMATPEEVFEEIAYLVDAHPDGVFVQYPLFLEKILQISWAEMTRKRPPDAEKGLVQRTLEMDRQIGCLTDTAYRSSEFGPHALGKILEACSV